MASYDGPSNKRRRDLAFAVQVAYEPVNEVISARGTFSLFFLALVSLPFRPLDTFNFFQLAAHLPSSSLVSHLTPSRP